MKRQIRIGNRAFETKGHTYIMGILNTTPDSFSDGGRYKELDKALFQVERMLGEGMDILDIGGESTRPGYTLLSEEEEISRILPVIKAVKERFETPISLDTYKAGVARAGLDAGADMINDIWGLRYDEGQMSRLLGARGVPCCLMHNRTTPADGGLCGAVADDLAESLRIAEAAGIERDKIILDPGVGFGKTYEDNLTIINRLETLHVFECPLLLGTSRKSVVGLTLELPVEERLEGTLVTTVWAVLKGCSFVRVHDVKENKRAVRMAQAILAERKEEDG